MVPPSPEPKTAVIRFFSDVNPASVGLLLQMVDTQFKTGTRKYIILMSSGCYAIGSKYAIGDRSDAVFYSRKAADAVRTYVEQNWDFGMMLSAELRWPITGSTVTVDVRLLDDAEDEGAFTVQLWRNGSVRHLEQTEFFTP